VPHGPLNIECSRVRVWPGTLSKTGVQVSTDDFDSGGNPAMDYNPIEGGVRNTPSDFMLQKPG